MELVDRIILGSANFGQAYGIIQNEGISPYDIMDEAWGLGIKAIDTARSYGSSEHIIAQHIKHSPEQDWRVISKFGAGRFIEDVTRSREVLGENLKIELIHNYTKCTRPLPDNAHTLYPFDGIYIGASTYGVENAINAAKNFSFVEIEYNMLNPNVLNAVKNSDCQLILRSVLQQGFLTELSIRRQRQYHENSDINFQLILTRIELHQIAEDYRMSLQELALKFVAQTTERELIIIGVHEMGQLTRNVEAMTTEPLDNECLERISAAVEYLSPEKTDLRNWLT